MEIIRTSTRFINGQWEVWALIRDEDGGLATRLIIRTPDLDAAVDCEKH